MAVFAACLALFIAACSGDNGESPPTATPPPTETQPPPPTSTVMPFTRIPVTFWLLDVGEETFSTVLEDYDRQSWTAEFGAAATTLTLSLDMDDVFESRLFDLTGTPLPSSQPADRCRYSSAEVDGAEHQDVTCTAGFTASSHHPAIAPGGGWFTYAVLDADDEAGPRYGRWALDLETGERHLLRDGLQDCPGCEPGSVASWAPSGRYLYFAETGPGQRAFLSDMQTGLTRDITLEGALSAHLGEPEWSPVDDTLLLPGVEGGVRLHDMADGTESEFADIAWPARFDISGAYLYTPASGAEVSTLRTTIADAATGEVIATLAGAVPPSTELGVLPPPIVGTEDGFVAVLEHAPDCDGSAVYLDGDRAGCVSGGFGAVIAPNGLHVALARVTGFTGEVEFLGGSSFSLPISEIVLFDVETGEETVVAEGAISDEPPVLLWNETSTHLLIRWPFHGHSP